LKSAVFHKKTTIIIIPADADPIQDMWDVNLILSAQQTSIVCLGSTPNLDQPLPETLPETLSESYP
jgi:hypothetical protein